MNPDKIRNILNLLFIILTIIAIIIYFKADNEEINRLFIYVCGGAILVKVAELFIRFTHR